MANKDGYDITTVPVDIADGISAGTSVKFQNIGARDVLLFEGTEMARDNGGNPNVMRGAPFFDPFTYTIGSDPIWAWVKNPNRPSAISVTY